MGPYFCTDLFVSFLFFLFLFQRSAKLIPEDDQIFTEVELNTLEKVINETTVGCLYAVPLWVTVSQIQPISNFDFIFNILVDIMGTSNCFENWIQYTKQLAASPLVRRTKSATSHE